MEINTLIFTRDFKSSLKIRLVIFVKNDQRKLQPSSTGFIVYRSKLTSVKLASKEKVPVPPEGDVGTVETKTKTAVRKTSEDLKMLQTEKEKMLYRS